MASYPPFQNAITASAKQVDNPSWRLFFIRLGTLLTGAVTHSTGALTNSHLVVGNGAGDIRVIPGLGTATQVLHGNAGGDPSFSAVSLTADVTGTLPATNGGTGQSTVTQGDLLYGSASNVWSKLAKSTTATRYLANTGTTNNPAWDQVNLANGVTGTLTVPNGGTGITTLTTNRVPYGNGTSAFQSASNFTFDGTTFTTAGQIAFPATQAASSNANTLDDYEEGTWSVVLGGSGGTSGQTYATQNGSYVKVGLMVDLDFYIKLSAKGTITGDVQIQNFPFTIENTASYRPTLSIGFWDTLNTSWVFLAGFGVFNSTTATMYGTTAAAVSLVKLATGDITNDTQLVGHISYRATA